MRWIKAEGVVALQLSRRLGGIEKYWGTPRIPAHMSAAADHTTHLQEALLGSPKLCAPPQAAPEQREHEAVAGALVSRQAGAAAQHQHACKDGWSGRIIDLGGLALMRLRWSCNRCARKASICNCNVLTCAGGLEARELVGADRVHVLHSKTECMKGICSLLQSRCQPAHPTSRVPPHRKISPASLGLSARTGPACCAAPP